MQYSSALLVGYISRFYKGLDAKNWSLPVAIHVSRFFIMNPANAV